MPFAAASERPIRGAVATLGVSDRVSFLRKTYAHLGGALIAWPLLTALFFKFAPEASLGFAKFALGGWNWLLVIGLFMGAGYIATRLATHETSRGLQYLGLGIEVGAWVMLMQPILWVLVLRFDQPLAMLAQAGVITLAIFVGLTLTVFLTKKDFTFMGGFLKICTFAALGVIVASILFGFSLGALFCGAIILLMAGYILYQTSAIMSQFPPTAHVAAALMLFSTVATLFWNVLQLLMTLRRD
ncbi:MAG: Bax inhibitor-1 family protein [Kofleriaceae bacterium]